MNARKGFKTDICHLSPWSSSIGSSESMNARKGFKTANLFGANLSYANLVRIDECP